MEPVMRVDIVSGVEGPSLYFDDHRVDGPKPWGGGRILHTFIVLVNDLDRVSVLSKALAEAREQGAREEQSRLIAEGWVRHIHAFTSTGPPSPSTRCMGMTCLVRYGDLPDDEPRGVIDEPTDAP